MMISLRPMFVAAVATCLSGTAGAADYRSAANGTGGVMDTPSASQPRPIAPPRGLENGAPWTITCYDYPGYRVKELDGDGKGTIVVSVQASRLGAKPPVCGPQDDPGERVVSKQGLFLVGARGGFVILGVVEGPTFVVFDAASGKQVYEDAVENGNILSLQAAGDAATMTYVRYVAAPCSLLTGGAACWQRFVTEARLPAEVARIGPISAACEAAFRAGDPALKREDYNVLTYEATVRFDRSGHSAVLSRANPGCSYSL